MVLGHEGRRACVDHGLWSRGEGNFVVLEDRKVRVSQTTKSRVSVALLALGLGVAGCTGGSANFDASSVKSDVSTAYRTVFNLSDKNVNGKVRRIQNGPSVRVALEDLLSNPLSNSLIGAQIFGVSLTSSSTCHNKSVPTPCATVSYNFVSAVSGAVTPSIGYATFQDSRWLVAKVTVCDLLASFYGGVGRYHRPPGC